MTNTENKKRLNKEWYTRVKDTQEHKDKKRVWYLANREEILRVKKQKNDARLVLHPRILKTEEEKKAKRVVWNLANKEKRNADAKKWRNSNLEKQQKYAREYYSKRLSTKVQYTRLINDSRHRNLEVAITFEEFSKFVESPCKYCGEMEKRRGLDRVDNNKGYININLVACCKVCNYMKRNYTLEEFLNHAKKIHEHNKNRGR